VDPEHGSEMVESLNHFLKVYDTSDETFETLVDHSFAFFPHDRID